MAAAGDQAEERRVDRVGLEEVRRHVPVQVVHRHEGEAIGGCERLRGRETDEEGPDQPRPARRRNRRQPIEPRIRAVERVFDDGVDELEMVPRGHFRDHSPVALVKRDCDEIAELRISPSAVTTAAHVSSQEVSIPR